MHSMDGTSFDGMVSLPLLLSTRIEEKIGYTYISLTKLPACVLASNVQHVSFSLLNNQYQKPPNSPWWHHILAPTCNIQGLQWNNNGSSSPIHHIL